MTSVRLYMNSVGRTFLLITIFIMTSSISITQTANLFLLCNFAASQASYNFVYCLRNFSWFIVTVFQSVLSHRQQNIALASTYAQIHHLLFLWQYLHHLFTFQCNANTNYLIPVLPNPSNSYVALCCSTATREVTHDSFIMFVNIAMSLFLNSLTSCLFDQFFYNSVTGQCALFLTERRIPLNMWQ